MNEYLVIYAPSDSESPECANIRTFFSKSDEVFTNIWHYRNGRSPESVEKDVLSRTHSDDQLLIVMFEPLSCIRQGLEGLDFRLR